MKYAWIELHSRQWPVPLLCRALGVSPSGYHARKARDVDTDRPRRRLSNDALLVHIKAVHAESKGEYGWPRVWKRLLAQGIRVSKDRVQRLMKLHGIKAKTKRRFKATTDSNHGLPVAPDLLQRDFSPARPDQAWSTDITISGRTKAGCIWPSSSTCSAVRWWAGRCSRTCARSWYRTRCVWRGFAAVRKRA
jgi:transposase InsO family protein